MNAIQKAVEPEWYADVPRSIRSYALAGAFLIVVCMGGFSAWAMTAPLAAAVIAQGTFVATGYNKVVQHLEGGIIKDLLVKEGDHVKEGQPLITLDRTAALAGERRLRLRRIRLEAVVARLQAEAQGLEAIRFPDSIVQAGDDSEIADIAKTQETNFGASRNKLNIETDMIERNIEALKVRADGYQHELTSMQMQKSLLDEELHSKSILYAKGLIRGPEMKSIQRAIADAEGNIGRLKAEIGEIQIQVTRYEEQIRQALNAYRQAALDELQSAEADLDSVSEESRQAEDILKRTTIDAPVSGTVIRMYYHTSGGVIESGKAILEILPSGVPLIIEAQVPRTQIDNVHVGQKASVRLTALNRRTTPILDGDVFYVSADALPVGSGEGLQDYYLARVEISPSELARVHGFVPTPGMPAEILIETSERTFFAYLVKPIRDSMSRAFMEN